MTLLHRVRADQNMARFYALCLEKSLFGEFVVIRLWGRIGRRGQSKSECFPMKADAERRLERLAAAKRRRGYVDQTGGDDAEEASDRLGPNLADHRLGLVKPPAYDDAMQSFIDLEGASGATYRFHRVVDLANLPAIAGNFAYVQGNGPNPVVVCCGTDETLLKAAARWSAAQQVHRATAIYVRRNVSWRTRAHEHADIVAKHRPPLVVAAELDRSSGSVGQA